MDFIKELQNKLEHQIYTQKVFFFNNQYFTVFAYEQGYKCDCLSSLKKELKCNGFVYSYDYDCYIKRKIENNDNKSNSDNRFNDKRTNRTEFLTKLIEWKLMGNKKYRKLKHNEQNERIQK